MSFQRLHIKHALIYDKMHFLQHITLGATSVVIRILKYSRSNQKKWQKMTKYANKCNFGLEYLEIYVNIQVALLRSDKGHVSEKKMQSQHVTCRKTSQDCKMCYYRCKVLVAMVTMKTSNVTVKTRYTSINSAGIWVSEYGIHSVVTLVHLIEIFDYLACVICTQIQRCFALTTNAGYNTCFFF